MPECLTVGTYNILKGINADRIIKNVAQMKQQGVDILCLQEVHANARQPFIGDQIEACLGTTWGAVYFTGMRDPSRDHGLATYWNKDTCTFDGMEIIDLPLLESLGPYEALHSWHKSTTMRGALSVRMKIHERMLKITNVHLDLLGGIRQRMRQFCFLQRFFSKLRIGYRERLDHLFARGMQGEESRVLDLNGSDHYPLVCRLRFPEQLIC